MLTQLLEKFKVQIKDLQDQIAVETSYKKRLELEQQLSKIHTYMRVISNILYGGGRTNG